MQLARLGEIGAIQKLFASGKFDANYADAEGITPLHVWPKMKEETFVKNTELINFQFSVGRDQQPLCAVPFPDTVRSQRQRKRWRSSRNTSPMGRKEV